MKACGDAEQVLSVMVQTLGKGSYDVFGVAGQCGLSGQKYLETAVYSGYSTLWSGARVSAIPVKTCNDCAVYRRNELVYADDRVPMSLLPVTPAT